MNQKTFLACGSVSVHFLTNFGKLYKILYSVERSFFFFVQNGSTLHHNYGLICGCIKNSCSEIDYGERKQSFMIWNTLDAMDGDTAISIRTVQLHVQELYLTATLATLAFDS